MTVTASPASRKGNRIYPSATSANELFQERLRLPEQNCGYRLPTSVQKTYLQKHSPSALISVNFSCYFSREDFPQQGLLRLLRLPYSLCGRQKQGEQTQPKSPFAGGDSLAHRPTHKKAATGTENGTHGTRRARDGRPRKSTQPTQIARACARAGDRRFFG